MMKKLVSILLILSVLYSCDDDDNTISVGLLANHRGVYINDFYVSGILGDPALEDALLSWVDENDFTDIYLYNIGAILADGLDNELRTFVNKAHNQNPYVRVSFVSAGFGDSFTALEQYHDGRKDSKPDGIVSEIEFWNGSMNYADDYAPWIDRVNDLKFTVPLGEVTPRNSGITRQFYIGQIKDSGFPPSLTIAKELVLNHDQIFLTNYHTDAWLLSGSMAENSILNKLNLLAQAGMELNKEVHIVILFNINQMSASPQIWNYFATSGMDMEFEEAFASWSSEFNSSTAITNKEFLKIEGFGIYRYSDALNARP